MSAKECLEEAIRLANKQLEEAEEYYYNLPPGERESTSWGQQKEELIESLRDALEYMNNAYELLED